MYEYALVYPPHCDAATYDSLQFITSCHKDESFWQSYMNIKHHVRRQNCIWASRAAAYLVPKLAHLVFVLQPIAGSLIPVFLHVHDALYLTYECS